MSSQFTRIYYDAANVIVAVETQDTPFFQDLMDLDGGIVDRVEEFDLDAVELTESDVIFRYTTAGYSDARAQELLDELKDLSAESGGAEVEPTQSAVVGLRNLRISMRRGNFFAREFRYAPELLLDLEFDSTRRVRFKPAAPRPTPINNARDAADPKRPGDTDEGIV